MVKFSARQVRSMCRDLSKTNQEVNKIRKKAVRAVSELVHELAIEKQTSTILRGSLQNFSKPLYKLKRQYKRVLTHVKSTRMTI